MSITDKQEKDLASALTPHFLGSQQLALVKLGEVIVDTAGEAIQLDLDGLQEQINDFHDIEGASLIGIEDAGGHFTGTTVEEALAELAVGSAAFDPSSDQTITGTWSFSNQVTADILADDVDTTNLNVVNVTFIDGAETGELGMSLTDSRVWTLPDSTGTVALTDDIPDPVNLTAGENVTIVGSYPDLTISATAGGGIPDAPSDGGTYARRNSAWVTAGGGTGSVTSVQISGSTGLSFSGGPITSSGTINGTLSSNLQSWSSVAPSSKANTNAVVATSGNQSGIAGNKEFTGDITARWLYDSLGWVRRPTARTATGSGNFSADDANGVVEKTNTSNLTWTIPSGLGTFGDMITVSNQGSSGTVTIARGSGVGLWRNGSNANIVVQPGSTVTIFRTSTNNRWSA